MPLEQPASRKLSLQMLILILGTVSFVLVGLSLITYFHARRLIVKELKAKSRNKVDLASHHINAWLQKKKELFKAISMRINYQDKGPVFNASFFKRMLKQYSSEGVESIYMGYQTGAYCTGTGWVPPSGWDFTKRPWYREASAKRRIVYTAPYVDARTRLPMITIAGPLYREGVLYSVMSIDVLIEDINRAVNSLKVGDHSRAYVTDGDGRFISHYTPSRALRENIKNTEDREIFSDFLAGSGENATTLPPAAVVYDRSDYVVVSRIPEIGWTLFFHLPKSEVNRPLKRLFWTLLLGISAALLLLGVTIFALSRRITRPILELASQSHRVAQGDYDIHLHITSNDEIGYVTHCFNDMAEGLKEREFIKSTFGRYVSKDVMQDILQGNISLGGEKRELSILFSDIRGFTNLSEGLDPIELVRLLNAYFKRMDQAITQTGGSINKYLGDGILAIFGAPNKLENSALAAVQSAHGKIAHLAEFNKKQGTSLKIGIGIHTGEAVVGNIGCENRTEYAVIGESVNMSDKVESMTKFYGVPLLITEPTAQKLPDTYLLLTIDSIACKFSGGTITLFTPYLKSTLTAPEEAHIREINRVMEHYIKGNMREFLHAVAETFPEPDTQLTYLTAKAKKIINSSSLDAISPVC
ncbi:HAMP domain-containing protein [Myxococcota bacterium]|nr:HAMP domain-containing protein [Myxococcota bacterium]MBU1536460.1 HAMP domain-containing protein [Myxococcota bacterium]